MLNKYIINHISLFIILLCNVVFADEAGVITTAFLPLDGLRTISEQNSNLAVQGNDVEMAVSTMNNMVRSPGGVAANGVQGQGIHEQDTEFILEKLQRDSLGYRHIRLQQSYKGLPVVGAESIIHINSQNVICKINGKHCNSDSNISVKPDINADTALQIGLGEHSAKAGLQVSRKPTLVIYGHYLAYHYVISYEGSEPGQWWYYVDAHTGLLIDRYNNIQDAAPNQASGSHTMVNGNRLTGEDGSSVSMNGFYESSGSGNYFLYNFNEKWGVYDRNISDWEQISSSSWGTADQAAVSAAKNLKDTQDWVTTVLGRDSFNNAGAFARANVHEGTNYINAYWDGTDFHFGDGNGSIANALTVLDIVGHEYGHAITQYTSNLIYSYESGALNESFSDIMGTLVEFAKQTDGTAVYPSATPGHSDWLCGEDCWLPNPGDALRDMRNPQRYQQPSYYQGTYWYTGGGDNGGVHTNSGVQNFAFYLLAVGGSGTNDGHSYGPITGLGVVAAGNIAMRANMVYLTSSSQYADAADAWISAAEDLGYSTATVEAVWSACGVSTTSPAPAPSGDTYEPDNSSTQAKDIISGSQQTHSINPVGDEDWMKFTIASPSGIVLQTSGAANNDTRMWLYDSNLNLIEYNDDGGTVYYSKIERVCGTNELPSGTYYVKIDEYGGNQLITDYNISLTVTTCQPIMITSPNGGENWYVGMNHNVTWLSTGNPGSNVKIEYSTNDGSSWNTIINSTPNDGGYNWTVPNDPSTSARVRVTSTSDSSYTDTSKANFTIILPTTVSFPFTEDFEGGILPSYWISNSTGDGRIQVTTDYSPYQGNYHLTMDDSVNASSYALNELILNIDLSGRSGVDLSFYHKGFNDENNVMPSSFTGSHNSDGVAISADGITWYKIQGLTSSDGISNLYKEFIVDLDAAISSAGISYNNAFMIKFQQYDNYPIISDGFAFDSIRLNNLTFPTWSDTVGVTVAGNTITKNGSTGWGNSGAASQESFTGNGGIEFAVTQADTYSGMIGLSSSNTDASFKTIEYAVFLYLDGIIRVREKGVHKGEFGTYRVGDRFSVERVGSAIVYRKNDTIFYTSQTPTTAALLADFAIYDSIGTISNLRFAGTAPGVPGAIADCKVVAGDTTVDLYWTAPPNNLSPITEYDVQYGTVASGNFDTIITDDAVPGATVTGLTNGVAYQFRVVAKNAVGAGPVSNVVNATPLQRIVPTWIDTVGVTVAGNTITKNGPTGWGNCGAASQEKFTNNGCIQFAVTQADTYSGMIGLSSSNTDAGFATIEYAVFLYTDKIIRVREKGIHKGEFGTYQNGDGFRVERIGSTIVYKKNGAIFYTSQTPTDAALLVDFAVYDIGATISNVTLLANEVSAAPVLNTIADITVNEGYTVKFSPTATDSDGDALTFSYSGWMTSSSYTTNYTDSGVHTVTVTVSDGTLTDAQDVTVTVADVNVAPVLNTIADITVNEGDVVIFSPTATDSDGDTLTFSYSGWMTSDNYTTNYTDSGVHTVTVTVSDGTLTDTQDVTVTVSDAAPIQTVIPTWVDMVGVTVAGNTITKNGPTGWGNSGAASQESFTGNGGVEFAVTQADTYSGMIGLSSSNTDASFKTIEYAVFLYLDGIIRVRENGVHKGEFGTYQVGDKFSVERAGSTIVYKKNGTIFYTSLTPTTAALLVDFTIYDSGGTISNLRFVGTAPGVPGAIADCKVVSGDTRVDLEWAAAPNNLSPITEYEVQYGTVASGNFDTIFTDDAVPGAAIAGLANGTAYQFRVVAKNAVGTGLFSNVVNATPLQRITPTWVDMVGVTVAGNTITKNGPTGWGNSGAASQESFTGNGGIEFAVTQTDTYSGMIGLSSSNTDASFKTIEYAVFLYLDGIIRVRENGVHKGEFGTYQVRDKFSVERAGSTIVYKKNGTIFYTSLTPATAALLADFAIYDSVGTISDIRLMVRGINAAPVLDTIADITVNEGDTVTLSPTATDSDGDTLTFSYSGWMTSDNYMTNYTDSGVHTVTVTVSDGTLTDAQDVTVTVADAAPIQTVIPTWVDMVGVTVAGNTITKNGPTGWGNSGAASQESFTGNGGIEFAVTQADTYSGMIGLSSSNTDASFKTIEYAVFLYLDGIIRVRENGVHKGEFGTYQVGDKFSVERAGSTIVYKKNGTIFYTSLTPTTAALLADFAIYDSSGTISNIRFVGITPGVQNISAIYNVSDVNFSYFIGRYSQHSDSSTFKDEFDDGDVPPGGPSGPTTYILTFPFSVGAESSNRLNLHSSDAGTYTGANEEFIGAALWDPGYDFDSGLGGSVEGTFRFSDGITKNTGFEISISTYDTAGNPDIVEDVSLSIEKVSDIKTYAYFKSSLYGEETEINKIDVTGSLNGITDLTLRLGINTSDGVTASLDYGSDGTYDKTMDGSHDLTFTTGSIYTGYFGAWKNSSSEPVCETPSGISVPTNDPDGDYTVSWDQSNTSNVTYILEEATDSNFTVDLRTAYTGTGTSAAITGRSYNQTYYYRVKARKNGYRDSAWKKGLHICTVSQRP